ncbi:MAG: mechanosensitive ion channel family protein [Planctomycetota bacterium]|jgi:small conductance mechanosensitive channel
MDWSQIWTNYGLPAFWALVILAAGWIGARVIRAVIRRLMRRASVDPTLVGFFANLVYTLLLAFVVVSALDRVGVATGSFVAIIGAAGLAVGLALQSSLANFAAGVMIILFRPFQVGQFIEGGGVSGTVVQIQVFSTILNSPDNKKVVAPNGALMKGTLTNFSANDTRRIDLTFSIGYQDDLKKARQILEEIVHGNELVLKDPAPAVALGNLADSGVDFLVRPWVKTSDYGTVKGEILEAVKLRFDESGITIPYPQREVHLRQVA